MESKWPTSTFGSDSYFGSLLLYAIIAIVFFYIGRHYDTTVNQLQEKTKEKKPSKVSIGNDEISIIEYGIQKV